MQHLFRSLAKKPLFRYVQLPYVTARRVDELSDQELLDVSVVKRTLHKPIPKKTFISQRGLYNGKQPKTGNQSCFSEKKSRRAWMPNKLKKKLYSQVLDRDLNINITSSTLRTMRKYGGFDNYILLARPQLLDSMYGEYLRRLMLFKLNNPTHYIPRVLGAHRRKTKTIKRKDKLPPAIWYPPEIRHTDMSKYRMKMEHQLNPQELKKLKHLKEISLKKEDLETSQNLVQMTEQELAYEKWADVISKELLDKYKAKKDKEKVRRILEQVEKEASEIIQ